MRSFAFLFILSCCSYASFHVDYATFLGGSVDDQPAGITVDSVGNAYLVGTTTSPDFPLTSTAFGSAASGQGCAYVAKINPTGSGAVWSVCLANSKGNAIALDASGNVYVLTNSSTVTKLTAAADKIVYTKTIAASANGIAADAGGNAYVVGSAVQGFATTAGAYQPTLAPGTCYPRPTTPVPCSDAFVMKLAADGGVAYATYLGGSGPDQANAVGVDSQGNAWITGQTVSPNFPISPDALQTMFHGEVDEGPVQYGDAFVTKLDPTGGKLLYSTYLGGSAPDAGLAIAVDGAGAAYVGGATQSTDFPTTPGVVQRVYGGGDLIPSLASGDAFVVKFNPAGSLAYATYLGGPQYESAAVIGVDSQGDALRNSLCQHHDRIESRCIEGGELRRPFRFGGTRSTGRRVFDASLAGQCVLPFGGSDAKYLRRRDIRYHAGKDRLHQRAVGVDREYFECGGPAVWNALVLSGFRRSAGRNHIDLRKRVR